MIHAWHYHQNGKIDFLKSSFLDKNCYEISILFMKKAANWIFFGGDMAGR